MEAGIFCLPSFCQPQFLPLAEGAEEIRIHSDSGEMNAESLTSIFASRNFRERPKLPSAAQTGGVTVRCITERRRRRREAISTAGQQDCTHSPMGLGVRRAGSAPHTQQGEVGIPWGAPSWVCLHRAKALSPTSAACNNCATRARLPFRHHIQGLGHGHPGSIPAVLCQHTANSETQSPWKSWTTEAGDTLQGV